MDARKWSNVLSVARAYRSGHTRAGRGPREAYVEVSACCNLRCLMCPLTVDPRSAPGSIGPKWLTPELFERLAPLFPTLQRAHLFGLGEPLLNPHLLDFARRLSAAGVEVWTTTNGTRIDDEKAEAMAEAGFDRVTVSIDGARRETYERIRRRGRFDEVLRGVRALGNVRRKRGRPLFYLNFIAMASNLLEMSEIVELCAEVGGDGVFVETLYDWQHPKLREVIRREGLETPAPPRVAEALSLARRQAAAAGVALTSRFDETGLDGDGAGGRQPPESIPPASNGHRPAGVAAMPSAGSGARLPFPCSEPWSTVMISVEGEVRTCCFNDTVLGDLRQRSIREIWRGEPYIDLRRRHASLRAPESCTGCVSCRRVKRSPFLATGPPRISPAVSNGRGRLEVPGEFELMSDPLVVTGRLPRRRRSWPPGERRMRSLPEIFLDGQLLARLRDGAVIDGSHFAVVFPIPFVSEGHHLLAVRDSEEDGGRLWSERQIFVGRFDPPVSVPRHGAPELMPGELVAVGRLALAVHLERPERPPRLLLAGRRQPLETWICSKWGAAFRGVAVADLSGLSPGTYELELRLRHHPPLRRRFHRLAVEGSFGFGRAPHLYAGDASSRAASHPRSAFLRLVPQR